MISTVTTTVSTIVSSSAVSGLMASLGIAGVLTMIASLAMKELATAEGTRFRAFGRHLNILILPLIFVFLFIVVLEILRVLS
ncbi:MAG: hypothetical protein SV910_05155 [Chloroflexota bacterium]|nr:hypothetical protein [Chloroflexota bacterium]